MRNALATNGESLDEQKVHSVVEVHSRVISNDSNIYGQNQGQALCHHEVLDIKNEYSMILNPTFITYHSIIFFMDLSSFNIRNSNVKLPQCCNNV